MVLENDFLSIQIKNTGAELGSLFHKKQQTELLWQGDATFWSGQAPVLFPIVGMLKNGSYNHEGQTYKLPRHGLARKSNQWSFEQLSEVSIKGILKANEETLKVYPFDFELGIEYQLKQQVVTVIYSIKNLGEEKMPFSIGGHPAFNCTVNNQVSYSDYFLKFEKFENSKRHFLNKEGLFNGETAMVLNNTDTLLLTPRLFDDDALVFKDLKSESVILQGPQGKVLKVTYKNFKTLGVWAAPSAPFVCIEPWIGYADTINSTQNLFDKLGSVTLEAGKEFKASYQIEVF